jgi:hypothetical protein
MLTEENAMDKNPPVRVGVSVITPVSWKSAKTDLGVHQKTIAGRRTPRRYITTYDKRKAEVKLRIFHSRMREGRMFRNDSAVTG